MRSSLKTASAAAIFSLMFANALFAATTARIVRSIDSRQMSAVRGSVHPLARPEFDQGALANSQMLHRITLFFNRTPEQEQALDQLVREQQDPGSANYHQWLTPEQFGERFGLANADLANVKDWLTSQGFTIDEVSRSHSYIAFSGSVGQVSSALQTELHQYSVDGELHFANATNPSVPSAMRDVVAGFRALNDFRPKAKGHVRTIKPSLTSSLSGNHFLTPDDFASIYNLKALYAAGFDGSGQKIAVMGQTNITASDIATFRSLSGLPASAPQVVVPPGQTTTTNSGDVTEASLDIEWAGAVAPKATIIYVNSSDVFTSMSYAISNQVAPVISISYGLCEPDEVNSTFFTGDNNMLIQASAQGQTVVGPSGDDGAADCDFPATSTSPAVNVATHGLAVDFPASSPNVTGVGGTAFNEGSGTYWNTANNSNNGSALFYMPEIAWNDTPTSVAAGKGLAGTGGGVSKHYPKPTWQTGTGVPADNFRDVPDLSFNASPGHDGFIICDTGACQVCVTGDANCATSGVSPGFRRSSDQTFDVAGGTSAGVPAFAGVVALINQQMGSQQGNVNPKLYQLANSSAGAYIFHDVPPGSDNKVPCQPSANDVNHDCPSGGGSIGYVTTTGYDQVTGLGSVDAYNLVTNWNGTPAADFGVRFFNSTISVTKGSSVTIPIVLQKQNGFNGTVSLSCSSAMVGVTCSVSQATVTPDAAATVTITASASASLQAPRAPRPFTPWWDSALSVVAFFGMANKGKRSKRQVILLAVVALALLALLAGCGGGGSSTTTTTTGSGGSTSTGTSGTVTVTATNGGSITHTSQITVTVN